MNRRILWSTASIFATAALFVGATFAFFTDEETSSGNVFAAGGLDLLVDYDCYYNKLADGTPNCPWDFSSWQQTDLGPEHKFFNFEDIKPGDFGEGTISLHVFDNDAWLRLRISNVVNQENDCTEEEEEEDATCNDPGTGTGELDDHLVFSIWLDDGSVPGFQCFATPSAHGPCPEDHNEGNNFRDVGEVELVVPGTIDGAGETHNIWEGLAAAYIAQGCTGDVVNMPLRCPGLAPDGHMIGSVTYYFGIDWELPDTVGDEVQTDSLQADMTIEAEQYRHNSTPFL